MVQYIEEIIVPYVESIRADLMWEMISLIMDNFKGQVTNKFS